MEKLFNITLQNRKILYKFLKDTPREQLLKIPEGFRNNIWWNIAHVVVTQQVLIYKLSGVPMRVSDELVEKFRKGSVPDGNATDEEIDLISGFLFSTVEWMQEDYDNDVFKSFATYTTSVNITLSTVEDAIAFNVYHEGLHMGAILALLKVQL
ncbi:DinB family protein [Cellulophaga sp. HaHa_2_95]|uniref:DinB family protein n=1 Tax=unclassified Cellulophaga TaxID=2634405 RepID=UPI001C4EE1CC|nr:DinB family protein [Cellulophaga sp. HaHa_2_95]QXP56828.1 DinB family protein [Cellulophaga sp. HaHa_2_95]